MCAAMRERIGFARLAIVLLVASGCARTAPQTVIVVTPEARIDSLALTLEESDEDGGIHKLPAGVRGFVDVNSAVRITPRLPALRDATGGAATLARLRASLQATNAIIAAAKDTLRLLSGQLDSLAGEVRAARNANLVVVGTRNTLREVTRRKGVLLERVRVAARAADAARVSEIFNTVSGGDADSALVAVIAKRAGALLDSLGEETRRIAVSHERYRVELSAVRYSSGRAPVQLHLPGYDNIAAGDPVVIDKLSFSSTPEERAELERTTAAIRELVANAKDVGDVMRSLTVGSLDAAKRIVAAVDSVRTALRETPSAADLTDFLSAVKAVAPNSEAALTPLVTAVQAPLTNLVALRETFTADLRALRAQPSLMAPFDVLGKWSRDVQASVAEVSKSRATVVTALEATRASAEALATQYRQVPEDLRARLESTMEGSAAARIANAIAAISSALAEIESNVTVLQTRLDLFATLIPAQRVQSSGSVTLRDLIDVRGGEAGATTLELMRADRRDGDHVVVSLRLMDGDTRETVGIPVEYTVGVRNFGWYRRWSGGLAFAKVIDPDAPVAPAVEEKGFRPGVSASWIVHQRRRNGPDGKPKRSLFGDNGVGLALTSVLFTRDQTLELGFGPTVTFFRDILQVGGGINLQTEKWYFLLNTPLLEIIQRGQPNAGQP